MASENQKGKEKTRGAEKEKGYASDSQKSEKKAIWDAFAHEIWVDCFVAEIRGGKRTGTTLSREGWKNLVKNFNVATGRGYDKKQLKNHFDTKRKEWMVWNTLVDKETGVGWDHERQTVSADDGWWAEKIKKYPDAAKYRVRGLEHAEKLDEIYRDVTANGARAWAPTSSAAAPFLENSGGDDNDDDDGDDVEKGSDSEEDNGNEPTVNNITTRNIGRKRTSTKQGNNGKKLSASAMLCKKIDRMCDVAESKKKTDNPGCSIKEVIDYMGTMPECTPLSELYMFGTKLFIKRVNREMFMALPNDEIRLEWLKREQMESEASFRN